MTANQATVTATFSRRMRVQFDNGLSADARIKGKKLKPVCGDKVVIESLADEDDLLITGVSERRNELTRTNSRGMKEVLAANVDKLVVVVAATPKPDWFVVDRYLCAAELMKVAGIVAYNKIDLEPNAAVDTELQNYANLGYITVKTSAETLKNIETLRESIGSSLAIIVGQSGVGKSSLINLLVRDNLQKTAEISRKHREGRHTTVNSSMIFLAGGAAVIDSPGVRDYAPMLESFDDVSYGFREIRDAAQHCRFANCHHLKEPGCAVKDRVDTGIISARRYESFRRAVFLSENLNRDRY